MVAELLQTQFHTYRHARTGAYGLGVAEYSLPADLHVHVFDLFTGSLHAVTHRHGKLRKMAAPLATAFQPVTLADGKVGVTAVPQTDALPQADVLKSMVNRARQPSGSAGTTFVPMDSVQTSNPSTLKSVSAHALICLCWICLWFSF